MPFKEREDQTITKPNANISREFSFQKATTIVENASTNRNLVNELQVQGFENIKISYNDKKGNEVSQPPPNGFMDLRGFNKLEQFVITAERDNKTYNFEKIGPVVTIDDGETKRTLDMGGEQNKSDSQRKRMEFAEICVKNGKMTRDEADKFKQMNSNDAYDWLKNKGLLQDFMNWMAKELQKMAGSGEVSGAADRLTGYITQNILTDQQNEGQKMVAEREKKAGDDKA